MTMSLAKLFDNELLSDRVLCMVLPFASGLDAPEPRKAKKSTCRGKRKRDGKQEVDEQPPLKKLHVSSGILAAHSEFFMAMFTAGLAETKEKEFKIEVP
jgi:hypothetical protein